MTARTPGDDPTRPTERLSALASALQAGDKAGAARLAEACLAEGIWAPLALRTAALARASVGRFAEALELLRIGVRQAPGDAGAWSALAQGLRAARRIEAALAAADRALDLAPADPGLICAKAALLQELSRTEEAAVLFTQALSIDPNGIEARLGLALQAIEAGDWDAAQARIDGLDAGARKSPDLSWLDARIALGRGEPERARTGFATLASDVRLAPERRANAFLLMGEALDTLGLPAEAFHAAAEGKQLLRALFAQRAQERESEIAKLSRLRDWFAAADPRPWQIAPAQGPIPGQAASHTFLVGFPRSGTTLLEQVLAGHSGVESLEEAPTLSEAYAQFLSTAEGLQRLAGLSDDDAQAWRGRYWAEVARHGVSTAGKLFLDKQPAGTLYLPLIAKLFPGAKILFAVRDPRDVTLSCLRNNFQINAMTYAFTSLPDTTACYDACMGMAEVYRRTLPLTLIEVRHEQLVADFDRELARIAAFLDLPIEPAMADVAATVRSRSVRTPSAGQLRAGLNRSGFGRWRAYAAQMAPVLPVLAPWVRRFGYPSDAAIPDPEQNGGGAEASPP